MRLLNFSFYDILYYWESSVYLPFLTDRPYNDILDFSVMSNSSLCNIHVALKSNPNKFAMFTCKIDSNYYQELTSNNRPALYIVKNYGLSLNEYNLAINTIRQCAVERKISDPTKYKKLQF